MYYFITTYIINNRELMDMKEFINNLKRVWQYSKSQRFRIILYYCCHIINIANGIILPILYAKIIVQITNKAYYQLALMALIIFFIESLYSITDYFCTINADIHGKTPYSGT